MNDQETQPACTQRRYLVTHTDLPLSCPTAEMQVWNAHPRVYLPIETKGHFTCPYCGAEYFLKDFDPNLAPEK